jgi:ABC-type antimicrobial peptide transport system permease subunit
LLAAGLAIGVGLSLIAGRGAGSLLFGLKSYDPFTLAIACLLLIAIAIGASYVPAWRASRMDPMLALRQE